MQLFAWSLDKNAAGIEGTSKQPPSTIVLSSLCHMESASEHCTATIPRQQSAKSLRVLGFNYRKKFGDVNFRPKLITKISVFSCPGSSIPDLGQ